MADLLAHNRTLKKVCLHQNRIGDPGAAALAQALRVNTTLTYLELRGNPIEEEGAAALVEALRVNYALTRLALRIGEQEEEERVEELLERNKRLAAVAHPSQRTAMLVLARLPIDKHVRKTLLTPYICNLALWKDLK